LLPQCCTSAGDISPIRSDANGCYATFAASLPHIFFCISRLLHHANHIHLLVDGLLPTSDFLHFMKTLKIKTSREFASGNGTSLWQKKYFDHILRPKESMDSSPGIFG